MVAAASGRSHCPLPAGWGAHREQVSEWGSSEGACPGANSSAALDFCFEGWIFFYFFIFLELQKIQQSRGWLQLYLGVPTLTFFLFPFPVSSSIRQYELVVHTDVNINKVYTGEMGRLKSYENQKP